MAADPRCLVCAQSRRTFRAAAVTADAGRADLGCRVAQTLEKLSVGPELAHLVLAYTSVVNGCSFCADISRARAVQERLGLTKFDALADFRASDAFDERERAALAYADEVTRSGNASDETFAALRKHFDESRLVEIVWLTAVGNYYNLIAVPLGLESDALTELALRRVG